MTTVTGQPAPGRRLGDRDRAHRPVGRKSRTFTARHLILAAGTWGTQKLLFKMRDSGTLPKLSDKLGVLTRTNSSPSWAPGGWRSSDLDLTHGVAITSSIHPTPDTHVEPCRRGKGSNAMGLLQTLMTDGPARAVQRAALEAVVHQCFTGIRAACCACSARGAGASAR